MLIFYIKIVFLVVVIFRNILNFVYDIWFFYGVFVGKKEYGMVNKNFCYKKGFYGFFNSFWRYFKKNFCRKC